MLSITNIEDNRQIIETSEKDFFSSDIFNHNPYNKKSVQICLFDTAQQIFVGSSQGFFFTKKVTPIIGVFPSADFPQEKYFS